MTTQPEGVAEQHPNDGTFYGYDPSMFSDPAKMNAFLAGNEENGDDDHVEEDQGQGEETLAGGDAVEEEENQADNDVGETDDEAEEEQPEIIETDKGKMIPRGQFNQERAGRKDAEARASVAEDKYSRLVQTLLEMQGGGKQSEQQADTDEEWLDPQAKADVDKRLGKIEEKVNADAAQNEAVRVHGAFANQEQLMFKSTPDYGQSLVHLHANKKAEFEALGLEPDDADKQVMAYMQTIAGNAVRNGKNGPQVLYKLAQAAGYKPQAAKPSKPSGLDPQAIARNKGTSGKPSSRPAATSMNGSTADDPMAVIDKLIASGKLKPGQPMPDSIVRQMMGGR